MINLLQHICFIKVTKSIVKFSTSIITRRDNYESLSGYIE